MNRRRFIAGLMMPLVPRSAWAQRLTPARIPRVGILTPADTDQTPIFDALRRGLRELGYVEERDIILEFRLARGDMSAVPRLAADLVDQRVDIIVTDGPQVLPHVVAATKTIPIVIGATVNDPVMLGFASSDAHPGGNVTGFILHPAELSAKRLELLHAAFPDAAVVTALLNSAENLEEVYRATVEAGASHGLTIHRVEVDGPEALRMLRQDSFYPRAPLLVLPGAMFWNHRSEIIALAAAAHVPALYPEREYADDGGLIAYGANVPDNFRRAADYVDRILKGARPGDLPIQSPTKFDFIINLRTAKALGLTLPPSFLIRADEVIE